MSADIITEKPTATQRIQRQNQLSDAVDRVKRRPTLIERVVEIPNAPEQTAAQIKGKPTATDKVVNIPNMLDEMKGITPPSEKLKRDSLLKELKSKAG